MLELIIGPEDGVIENASVPVTWCLDKKTLGDMSDNSGLHILFEVEYEGEMVVDRYVEKLSNYMTYIPFRRPGKAKISAYIVATYVKNISSRAAIKTAFLNKNSANYVYNVKNWNMDYKYYVLDDDNTNYCKILETTESHYTVNIPKNVFGKEMSKTFKFAVNRYLENQTIDECHRNRRIISFFLIRIWIFVLELLWLEFRIVSNYILMFLFGTYKMDIHRIFHPFESESLQLSQIRVLDSKCDHILDIVSNYIDSKLPGTLAAQDRAIIKSFLSSFGLPLIPLVYMLYILIIYLFVPDISSIFELLAGPFVANSLIVLTLGIVMYLFFMLGFIFSKIIKKLPKFRLPKINFTKNFFYKFENVIYDNFVKKEDIKVELLTCNGDANSIVADIKRIPLQNRSISLIYKDLKNKVCKPMSR